jgi:hypothetical protein
LPSRLSAVSAWASKCTTPERCPSGRLSATAVALGQVMEWSPPMTTGTMPRRATPRTRSRIAACERSVCPCGHRASPWSTTRSHS